MRQVLIRLETADQVQTFVKLLSGLGGDFELLSGRHILDARSLMGLFSLDLSRPISLRVYEDSGETMKALAPYLLEEVRKHEQ